MSDSLKAAIFEIADGHVRDQEIPLHGAFRMFPNDCFGGTESSSAGATIELRIGSHVVNTDIETSNAVFRERGAIRRFFEEERVAEGDLLMIERLGPRSFALSKVSKRVFQYYL